MPVIVLVWANVHGSFFLGPLVLGLAWLEDLHDRIEGRHHALIAAIASAAAACVTPFGPAVWAYAVGLSVNPEVTRRISEWQPTSLRDGVGILFFASVLAVAVLLARRGSPDVRGRPSRGWACSSSSAPMRQGASHGGRSARLRPLPACSRHRRRKPHARNRKARH